MSTQGSISLKTKIELDIKTILEFVMLGLRNGNFNDAMDLLQDIIDQCPGPKRFTGPASVSGSQC